MAPDAAVKHLLNERGETRGGTVVDGLEDVAGADAGTLAGGVGGDTFGAETGGGFDPPDAVGGDVEVAFAMKIDCCEHAGRERRQSQGNRKDASLEGVLHRLCRRRMHLWGQIDLGVTTGVSAVGYFVNAMRNHISFQTTHSVDDVAEDCIYLLDGLYEKHG